MNTPKKSTVNLKTIATSIASSGAPYLKSIPEAKVARIINLALAAISHELRSIEQGIVRVSGLGVFRVIIREIEKDGKKVALRRVGYLASQPKRPKEK